MFHQFQELPHLIGLCLPLPVLDINEFGHVRMLEDVVAAAGPRQSKSEECNRFAHKGLWPNCRVFREFVSINGPGGS